MTFGKRLFELRKAKGLSQTELGSIIGIHKNVLGKYEKDDVKPSIDVAIRMAEALHVSLDYLVGKVDAIEVDKNLLEKLIEIQKLNPEDKGHIVFALEAMLRDAKARQTYAG